MFRDKKNLFLTYPRCALSKQEYVEWVLCQGFPIENYYVAQEKHKKSTVAEVIDGKDNHLHVYLKLNQAMKSRRTDLFDINGYHPNV